MDMNRKDEMHKSALDIVKSLTDHSLDSELEGLEYSDYNEDEQEYICEVIWAILEKPVIPKKFTE